MTVGGDVFGCMPVRKSLDKVSLYKCAAGDQLPGRLRLGSAVAWLERQPLQKPVRTKSTP